MKCVCFRDLIGEDCVNWRWVFHEFELELIDLAAGEDRSLFREEPEVGRSKLLWKLRFLCPVLLMLPLLGPISSENIAPPFRGELMRCLVFV